MQSIETLVTVLVDLIDPFSGFKKKYLPFLQQRELYMVKRVGKIICALISISFLYFYLFNDRGKAHREIWMLLRMTVTGAGAIAFVLLTTMNFSLRTIKILLIAFAAIITTNVAYSMSLGSPIQSKWLVYFSSLIASIALNSFVGVQAVILACLWMTHEFWRDFIPFAWLSSDVVLFGLLSFGVWFAKISWLKGQVAQLQQDEIRSELIIQRQEFQHEISQFISPVLVQSLEQHLSRGISMSNAIDSLLRLRRETVAVLYSDIRNYSARADNQKFIQEHVIPQAAKILNASESNKGVARLVGDAAFVFYCLEDSEESLLRAFRDAVQFSVWEAKRVAEKNSEKLERYFTVTYGQAFVGNIGSTRHREFATCGKPANLAARIDSLTKEKVLQELIGVIAHVLLSESAKTKLSEFASDLVFKELDLQSNGITLRSYDDEKSIYLFECTSANMQTLNRLLVLNSLVSISLEDV